MAAHTPASDGRMRPGPLAWIGLAGVAHDESPSAIAWHKRLHVVMIAIALLALPAYALEIDVGSALLHDISRGLDVVIFAAFLAETLWMVALTRRPVRYLWENWLNIVILVASLAALLGAATSWVPLVRVLRIAVAGLVFVRTLAGFGELFTRRGAPKLVGAAVLILLAAGGVLYWVEPTINSYWDGLWLAFVTGMTIGYGDVIPTTGPSRVAAAGIGLIGVAIVTLFTASIVSFFVGGDEARTRAELQNDMARLRDEIVALLDSGELRVRTELRRDVDELRQQIAGLVEAEELHVRRQFRHEIALLRAEIATLSAELQQRDARGAPPPPADER